MLCMGRPELVEVNRVVHGFRKGRSGNFVNYELCVGGMLSASRSVMFPGRRLCGGALIPYARMLFGGINAVRQV